MKRKMMIGAALLLTAGLAGCGSPATSQNVASSMSEIDYRLDDGRTIHCLVLSYSQARNGLSCDWANAR
jgi:hypothetical protein